jgi:integrase
MRHNPLMRTRYQRGTIRIRGGKVYGEWRGEPGENGKRSHPSVFLGKVSKGKTKNAWRDDLRPHIEAYYRQIQAPDIEAGMTLQDFAEQVFLPAHEPGWAKTSSASLKSNLKQNILKQLGSCPMSSIVKAVVVQRLNEMRAAGYAKQTIVITKWLLRSLFEEAIDNDLIAKTPVRRIKLTNIPAAEETRPLTEDEVRILYAATSGLARIAWRLLIGCGLRPGEFAALRRNDVGDSLRIDETIALGAVGPTKTRTVRYQPLSASLRAELEAWMRDVEPGAKSFLFTRPDGSPLSVYWMHHQIQEPSREASGIKDLTLRMARTTFGTLLEGDIKDVQNLMGHARPEMTLKHYKKSIDSRQLASIEELDRRLTRPALRLVEGGKS